MLPEIHATIEAIQQVRNPRFLATERGYHGAFYCALRSNMERQGLLSQKRILEMEYQKSWSRHSLSQRPDIVFHIPVEISGATRSENNFAVWALKFDASPTGAIEDFKKLDEMCLGLKYPLAIFVNVASRKTYLDLYRGKYPQRIHAVAAPGPKGSQMRYSFFENGRITNEVHAIRKVSRQEL
jgi:hypothetical protein